MKMKIGLIARADNSGLGMQTWEFYKHMQPYRTMVVDISRLNGNKQYYERYPENALFVKGIPTANDIDLFLSELDVVFIAESAYNPYLYTRARELGVKTVNQYNLEFFDWFSAPAEVTPDMLIAPSMWNYQGIDEWCQTKSIKHVYLHCPANREALPFREIKQARTFLHVAGRAAAHDRNGTETVIKASKYLETDAQIIIHFQGEQGLAHQATNTIADYVELLAREGNEEKVSIEQIEFKDYPDVYSQGDVLLLPRRYGGNCLPMNEALSIGMPVIMTDISPNNQFLPKKWLLPATQIDMFQTRPNVGVTVYEADPVHLARRIDKFFNMEENEMLAQNIQANNLAESISWANMKYKYQDALEALCNQS